MPRSRPPYPPEFRAEAVRLVKSSGDAIRQIAKDLGVSDQVAQHGGVAVRTGCGARRPAAVDEPGPVVIGPALAGDS